jgi:hypothetical protein
MQAIRFLSQTLSVLAASAVILAACGGDQAVTYAGDLTPMAGSCDPPGRAVLIKRGAYVSFTPTQGVLILNGQIGPDGHLTASADTSGADRQPYHLKLDAAVAGPAIAGTYVTPRCRYAVKLVQSP